MALSVYNSAAFSTASGLAVAGGATVSVRLESTGALAALYANRDSAGSPGLSNPLTADSSGRFTFYAALVDQGYSVTVTSGAESFTVQNVLDLEPYRVIVASPEDYGAFGDGIRDDSDAFAAAFTALGASNFELRGRSGSTYLIGASGISISNKSNAKIIGCGAKLKVNAVSTQSPSSPSIGSTVIWIDSCTKLEFSGWEIDGNSKASNVIALTSNTECVVQGNRISTGGLTGMIYALGNTRCKYLDNELISGTGTTRGMWIGNYSAGSMEADPEVSGNIVRSMGATGIVLAANGGRCYGNHISTGTAGSGIIFGGANGFASNGLSIMGNVCRGFAAGHGIQSDVTYASAADIPYSITITGNICEQNGGSGIYGVHLYRSTITANICRDNNVGSSGADAGIYIDDVDGVAICGNTCYDSHTSSPDSRTQDFGIAVIADVAHIHIKNVSITGNVCHNNKTTGVYVSEVAAETVDNVTITGNVCTFNGVDGIRVTETGANTVNAVAVTGNTCKNNGTVDIRVDILNALISDNLYSTQTGVEFYTFTNLDTTPSVKGRKFFRAANGSATSITAFDDGVNGQEIVISASNANTTIVHSSSLINKGAVNATISSDAYIGYRREGTVWREMFRSF